MSEFAWPWFSTPAACRPSTVVITFGIAWAGVRTCRLTVVDRVPPISDLESVPVIVSVYVPGGAPAVVIVSVEVKPPAVPLAGLKLADAPDGSPDTESPIVGSPESGEPATRASVTLYVFDPVVRIWRLLGLPATVKS